METDELQIIDELEFADAFDLAPQNFMRDYQQQAQDNVREGWKTFTRQLVVKATGTGKTVLFSAIATEEVRAGGRVLILAHTDELLEQAAAKLLKFTGLEAEKEKASDEASLTASVVVGSIQTLCREQRLTGWPDDHFSLVIVDEAHRILAPSYQKVVNYFHFGAESLAEDWHFPLPGAPFVAKAHVLGVTATDDRGDKRSLGEFFQHVAFEYGLIHAVRDGYLVRPLVKQVPLKIDLRGVKVSRTSQGSDLDLGEVSARIAPFLAEIARNIAIEAGDRKTVCFLPGVETARLLAEALTSEGLNASFVSGACPDRKEKLEAYEAAGNGSAICNAMLLTEGWDCPDVSCVVVLRPTKIRGLYVQCVGRGTRVLPGVIDGLFTAQERVAAIRSSAKPNLLILDFLWLSENLELVKPCDMVATRPEIREQMASASPTSEVVDLLNAEQQAEKDLLIGLKTAVSKHSKKTARLMDPLAYATSISEGAIKEWTPTTRFDQQPLAKDHIDFLKRNGIDPAKIQFKGLALKLIDRILQRKKLGLCNAYQLNFMLSLGIPEETASMYTVQEATKIQERHEALKAARKR